MNLYNAQNQVSQAAQTRNGLLAQLARATLKAPIDGVVTTVNIGKGLAVPSGDAIVIESSDLQVTTDVVESDLERPQARPGGDRRPSRRSTRP